MKTRWIATVAVLLASSGATNARADEAGLASPALTFSIAPGTAGGPWKIRVENAGDVPVRLAADPRLLVLEVTPPDGWVDPTVKVRAGAPARKAEAPKPLRCALPDDARPSTDAGQELVVPSKRSWSATINPLFYCFGARERAALVNGATVKAHFGWPLPPPKAATRGRTKPAVPAPPFVAAPVGAAVGKVAAVKDLEAAPVTLAENVAGATRAPAAAEPAPAPGAPALAVSMAEAADVARGAEIPVTVTVTNGGDKAAVLLFRAETLSFNVAGPAGSVACGSVRSIDSPIRELYATLGVKGRASLTVLLTAICPSDTFDEPGVYRVTPVLDTTAASGRPIGLKTWDDTVTGKSPMLLRVRSPRRPPSSPTRPSLD